MKREQPLCMTRASNAMKQDSLEMRVEALRLAMACALQLSAGSHEAVRHRLQ